MAQLMRPECECRVWAKNKKIFASGVWTRTEREPNGKEWVRIAVEDKDIDTPSCHALHAESAVERRKREERAEN